MARTTFDGARLANCLLEKAANVLIGYVSVDRFMLLVVLNKVHVRDRSRTSWIATRKVRNDEIEPASSVCIVALNMGVQW